MKICTLISNSTLLTHARQQTALFVYEVYYGVPGLPYLEIGSRIDPLDATDHRIAHLRRLLPREQLAQALNNGSPLGVYDDWPAGLLLSSHRGVYALSMDAQMLYAPHEVISRSQVAALVRGAAWNDRTHASFGGQDDDGAQWRYHVRPFGRSGFAFMDRWDAIEHIYRPALLVFDL